MDYKEILELSDDFSDEILKEMLESTRKKAFGKSSKAFPKEYTSLMGNANQSYICQNFESAKKTLFEIIRQFPSFSDPFRLLGLISKEENDSKKAAVFLTIANELSNANAEEWSNTAELYKSFEGFTQAEYCFGRAIKKDPLNISLHFDRIECCEKSGDKEKVVKAVDQILDVFNNDISILKRCAKHLAHVGEFQSASDILINALKVQNFYDSNILNMICELNEKIVQDEKLIEIFEEIKLWENYQSIDSRVLFSCLKVYSRTGKYEFCSNLAIEKILPLIPQANISHKIQISDLLSSCQYYEKALQIIEDCMGDNSYSKQEILHKAAILYSQIGDNQSACDAFQAILQQFPNSSDIKYEYYTFLIKIGKEQEAMALLAKDNERMEEEIFLSDDEQNIPFDSESHTKKSSISKFPSMSISLNNERPPMFFEKFESEYQKIKDSYSLENLVSQLSDAEILDSQLPPQENGSNVARVITSILKTEIKVQFLEEKVFHKFLAESKKRDFKKKMKTFNIMKQIEISKSSLIFRRKRKFKEEEHGEYLTKRKKKISKRLTKNYFSNLQLFSKVKGKEVLLNLIVKVELY